MEDCSDNTSGTRSTPDTENGRPQNLEGCTPQGGTAVRFGEPGEDSKCKSTCLCASGNESWRVLCKVRWVIVCTTVMAHALRETMAWLNIT